MLHHILAEKGLTRPTLFVKLLTSREYQCFCSKFQVIKDFFFRMYDVDGNGVIDQDERTKIVQAIYDMLGAGAVKPTDTAEERAKNIFNR